MALIVPAPEIPIKLHTIRDNPGATKERKRLGRGRASGHGKTCGRGHKGQKARGGNGKPRLGFEGGQSSILRKIPKRGFKNVLARELVPLRLNRLQRWIDLGRIDPQKKITLKELLDSKCIRLVRDGVTLLGDGRDFMTTPVEIEVTRATKAAIEHIEKLGGKITTVYYNKLGIRALTCPEKFFKIPKFARPMRKKDIGKIPSFSHIDCPLAYYTNPENRGYLAPAQAKDAEAEQA
ncbi:YmL10 [Massospora cicadina]|nr:YmL10 [Massospora cicadina]